MARTREFDDETAVRAARELFWERGYVSTSLADLQAATRLSRSSMYATYGSKRGLFERAALSYLAEVIDPCSGGWKRPDQARRRSPGSSWRWRRYCGPRTSASPSVAAS